MSAPTMRCADCGNETFFTRDQTVYEHAIYDNKGEFIEVKHADTKDSGPFTCYTCDSENVQEIDSKGRVTLCEAELERGKVYLYHTPKFPWRYPYAVVTEYRDRVNGIGDWRTHTENEEQAHEEFERHVSDLQSKGAEHE